MKRTKRPPSLVKIINTAAPTLTRKRTAKSNSSPLTGLNSRWWKQHSKLGRKPRFTSPEQLELSCDEYFQWVDNNPLYVRKVCGVSAGVVLVEDLPKMRAMTLTGLCIFLDITTQGWGDYRAKAMFSSVCRAVEHVIYGQKFVGAAAGLLNHAIIARDLGLVDRKDVTSNDQPLASSVIILPSRSEEPK